MLKRLRHAAPGINRVFGHGAPTDVLEKAAALEGLTLDRSKPEGWVEWSPTEPVVSWPEIPEVEAVSVVAPEMASQPLPNCISRRGATHYTTLREWVSQWPLGGFLAPFLKPDAVGARFARVGIPGSTESVYTKTESEESQVAERDHGREMAVTCGGIGYFPIMPATLLCVVMLVPAFLLYFVLGFGLFTATTLTVTIVSTVMSIGLERWAGRFFLTEDPREFVLDEVAGMGLAWILLPSSTPWWGILLAFFLFRLFDIFKWGVSWVEKLPVRGRIVWDDLLAGLYAGLVAHLIVYLWPF